MKIFHFVNAPLGIDQLLSGGLGIKGGGGWTAALINKMMKETDFNFAYAAFGDVNDLQHIQRERIDYFVIPNKLNAAGCHPEKGLDVCRTLVESWKPDIIHVHGTEGLFGLLSARCMVKYPLVISLQGLLGPCSEWYRFFGNQSLCDIMRMHRWDELITMRGLWKGYRQINKNAKREKEIITGNSFFMGRTSWDKAYIQMLNPKAKYYYEGRILRDAFWNKHWDVNKIKRHRIIFTNAKHPRKGTEILLEAAKRLKSEYPDIEIAIAGGIPERSGYGMFLRKRFNECSATVNELGALKAEQMTDELLTSHVFVSPSYIDNSPNAVAEAQLVGMPLISTYTGGLPSLIAEGRTGLFFPTGDAAMLAAKLKEIFTNDDLAVRLGNKAREIAIKRHNPDCIVQGLIETYKNILTT